MGIIGEKWKAVTLYKLTDKTLRYKELRKETPTVTEHTLSLQLKALEEDSLIKRTVYTSKRPLKVEYSLTDFGKTLTPLIHSIAVWRDFVVETYPSYI
ncbi:winged helix-turn-helix transcriptional regulator [Winogradskyella sediminis]|uniref:winged helix-turn-helix transcriptional regulator n=1 Tax=Winogradskyella sediminis TaxID=1382466 RepID=UPI003AA91033